MAIPKNTQAMLQDIDQIEPSYDRVKALWLIRTLLDADTFNDFYQRRDYKNERLMKILGLPPCDEDEITERILRSRLQKRRKVIERQKPDLLGQEGALMKNLTALGARIGLDDGERALLAFFVLICNEKIIADIIDYTGQLDNCKFFRLIGIITGLKEEDIKRSLKRSGKLHASGLLRVDRAGLYFSGKFDLLEGLRDTLNTDEADVIDLLREYFYRLPNSSADGLFPL